MRYLSLFSGIEAASCAWQPLGWELAGVCEIEKFPCNVLKHHYPDVPNLGDITQVGKAQLDALGHIDLIVGGSPCQGFSVAGKQEGLKDVRSKLAIDYLRVINTVKSKWIVWENVPGVFSTGKGMDFKLFTAALTHFGYGICWRVLDAQWFGVAQRRRRVFLVGYLGDWRPAYKVLFESQSLPGYFETLERTKERLTASAKGSSGKTGSNCLNPWAEQSKRILRIDSVSDCLCASEKMKSITKILDDRPNTCYDMNHPCDVIRTYEDGKTPTLEARMGTGGNQIPLVFGEGSFYQYKEVAVGSTLKAAGGALGGGSENFVIGMNHIAEKAESVVIGKMSTLAARQYKDPPIILDDQGGRIMNVSDDGKVGTLRAETHNHQPIVIESYRIGSYHSSGMKSDNPHSGIYETETANTLDASDPTPACQQDGIAVVSSAAFKPEQGSATRGIGWKEEQSPTLTGNAPAVCVQGSMIGRKEENDPQGSGINIDKCFTRNTTDRHAVATQARVRKLTPKECLRLQGFPADWFDSVEGYSDTAAYKAIGNSMCVNVMHWLGKHIDTVEKEQTRCA